MAKRTIRPEWVAIDGEGKYWAYYKPGEIGNRSPYGYIGMYGCICQVDLHSDILKFTSMESAACYLKALAK